MTASSVGPEADRRNPLAATAGQRRRRQIAARAGVDQPFVAVWRGSRVADLPPRAEALVRQPVLGEPRERAGVHLEAVTLPPDRSVPVQAERRQIGLLRPFVHVGRRDQVEVLGPEHESIAGRTGGQPGDHRRPEVAEMQVPRR